MNEAMPPTGRDQPDAAVTPPLGVPSVVAQAPEPAKRRRFGRRRDRVSKWDRPRAPRDWRFFVGGFGKVLIAVGLMLFGFVAYQLWGTGLETAREQNRLEDEFAAALAEVDFDAGPTAEPASADDDTADNDTADDDTADDGASDDAADDVAANEVEESGDPVVAEPDTDEAAPGDDEATGDSDDATSYDIPPIIQGEPLARLEIPSLDQTLVVVPGVGVDDLKKGPGHYPDTPLPGQLGNSAIAGHRTTYGEPFIDLDDLVAGDEIIITTLYGRFVYDVTATQVVEASDSWVIQTEDWETATLTLTTCHPKYSAAQRLIVSGELNPDKSSNVGVSTFYQLGDSSGEIDGDDPTVAEDATATTTATTIAEGTATTIADDTTTTVPVTVPPVTDADAAASTDDDLDPQDAFSRGWFDDEEAFPQIALWGAALTLISLLAYAISRQTRHDSIGFLVGVAPFAVAMFFFFQNVHRLLPPGL